MILTVPPSPKKPFPLLESLTLYFRAFLPSMNSTHPNYSKIASEKLELSPYLLESYFSLTTTLCSLTCFGVEDYSLRLALLKNTQLCIDKLILEDPILPWNVQQLTEAFFQKWPSLFMKRAIEYPQNIDSCSLPSFEARFVAGNSPMNSLKKQRLLKSITFETDYRKWTMVKHILFEGSPPPHATLFAYVAIVCSARCYAKKRRHLATY